MVSRLESSFPDISEALINAEIEKKELAALRGCEYAVSETGLKEECIDYCLGVLRGHNKKSENMEMLLEKCAGELDEEYFRLDELGSSSSLDYFSKARAAFSLSYALKGNQDSLLEAIYESLIALDDSAVLERELQGILS